MYSTINQFNATPGNNEVPSLHLNKRVKKSYPGLAEQLTIQLRQKKLAEHTCYPWQLDC